VSRRIPSLAVLAAGYVAGAVPFANIAARRRAGIDLRSHGTGTVSGTGLYEVAGFAPLAAFGVLEVAKGAVGPLLAGRRRPGLAAVAGGVAVTGHNWSPFLGGSGGRGISPAVGALLVNAWPGGLLLLAGLGAGRLAGETALGSFAADMALVPVVSRTHGRRGALTGLAVLVPLIVKRLAGNAAPPDGWNSRALWRRLLFDADARVR